jgi:hypothetical protein
VVQAVEAALTMQLTLLELLVKATWAVKVQTVQAQVLAAAAAVLEQ